MHYALDRCYFVSFQSLSSSVCGNQLTVDYKEQNTDKWPNLTGSSAKMKTQNGLSVCDLVPSWGSLFPWNVC